jgi:hypothetical protein
MVELLYAAHEYHAIDKLHTLTHNPYPARFNTIVFEQPMPDDEIFRQNVPYTGQIYCGHNPFLFARLVDNLRPKDPANPDAGLVWDERPHQELDAGVS